MFSLNTDSQIVETVTEVRKPAERYISLHSTVLQIHFLRLLVFCYDSFCIMFIDSSPYLLIFISMTGRRQYHQNQRQRRVERRRRRKIQTCPNALQLLSFSSCIHLPPLCFFSSYMYRSIANLFFILMDLLLLLSLVLWELGAHIKAS